MAANPKQAAPGWARALDRFNTYLSQDMLGGPRVLKMAWAINLHKGATLFVVALLMLIYRNSSTAAWVYLALHGSYGLCWLLKHAAFPDPRWEVRVTYGGAAVTFLLLATYWIAPFLLISDGLGPARPAAPGWLLWLSITLFVLGLAVMLAADAQKYFTLKHRRGLITTGMYRYIRHPNYLGEMMLYAAFALLARHWLPWLVLAYWWGTIFLTNMHMIAASLSRYPEWQAYKAHTGMLLPRLFPGDEPAGTAQAG